MSVIWIQSLRVQIGLAVFVIFLLLAASLGYTLYALNLRQHDYLILNLTGQLRVLSQTMTEQSINYAQQAPDDFDKYDHDLKNYWPNLQKQLNLFEKITLSLESRVIDAELGGHGKHSKIQCTWDDRSRLQMDITGADWRKFKKGLDEKIGNNLKEPQLNYAAEYISQNGNKLIKSSERLAIAFKDMMEEKLDFIRLFQWISFGVGLLFLMMILAILYRYIFKPLNTTIIGFSQVANGNFEYQLPVGQRNEIGQMTHAFNRLTKRLSSMFKLTERINQGKKLEETLEFVYEEFQSFVPFDWVGVFFSSPDSKYFLLERCYSPLSLNLREGDSFNAHIGGFGKAYQKPMALSYVTDYVGKGSIDETLVDNNLNAAVFLPLLIQGKSRAVMIFASNNQTFQQAHVEFLANIGSTITHVLEKTIVVESLVASAVEGLAKLAESRDPETGDHLLRMAHYSALIAEELGRKGPYIRNITPAYVRDVFRFAPMHDIGKVGVRDGVLLKANLLNADERKEIELHPTIGGEVLRRCEAQMEAQGHKIFQTAIEIAECHHEKFNGSGYPAGLKGQEIPLSARIVTVADVFDALTSKRPYKEAWPIDKAIAHMKKDANQHFDPAIIEAMERSLSRILEIYNQYKHV
jgi:response regulator RpfG family c-di-GMP phosphodiesterase/HAMP domain-containing protein